MFTFTPKIIRKINSYLEIRSTLTICKHVCYAIISFFFITACSKHTATLGIKSPDKKNPYLLLRDMFADNSVLKQLLERHSNRNIVDKDGRTSLHVAAAHGNVDVVKVLLASDANPNLTDKEGNTLLHVAAANGHVGVIDLLRTKNTAIDVNSLNNEKHTALYLAALNGNRLMIESLLKYKDIQVNKTGFTGESMLNNKRKRKNPDKCCEKGTSTTPTPFFIAAANGHEDVVRVLLGVSGIDVNKKDNNSITPLFAAVRAKDKGVGVVKTLLDFQEHQDKDVLEINRSIKRCPSPLYRASADGSIDLVNILLGYKYIDVNLVNEKNGFSALLIAAYYGHLHVVEALLNHKKIIIQEELPIKKQYKIVEKAQYAKEVAEIIAEQKKGEFRSNIKAISNRYINIVKKTIQDKRLDLDNQLGSSNKKRRFN